MQTAETTAERCSAGAIPSNDDSSFAGVFASLAGPSRLESGWSDDALAEDVATISYDRALRRFAGSAVEAEKRGPGADPIAEKPQPDATPKALKTASITIRLSEPECTQLRQRAAEAGLTISAYLRSCTLEVESLRAQVKDALAQMKSRPAAEPEREERQVSRLRTALIWVWRWLDSFRRPSEPEIRVNPANPFAPVRFN